MLKYINTEIQESQQIPQSINTMKAHHNQINKNQRWTKNFKSVSKTDVMNTGEQ